MTSDREQTRRDASRTTIARVLRGTLGTHEAVLAALDELDALLAELEQAERERHGLVEAIKGLLAAADEAPDDWMYEAEELQACRAAVAAYEQDTQAAHGARGNATEERTRRSSC